MIIKAKEENDEKYEEQLRADKYEKELLIYKNKKGRSNSPCKIRRETNGRLLFHARNI